MAIWAILLCSALAADDDTIIKVDASKPIHRVSHFLYGSCIEDVNHEVYGGIYSQMIFGESFQEPLRGEPVKGMIAGEGEWKVTGGGVLEGGAGQGPKLIAEGQRIGSGEVGVEIYLPGNSGGNA